MLLDVKRVLRPQVIYTQVSLLQTVDLVIVQFQKVLQVRYLREDGADMKVKVS